MFLLVIIFLFCFISLVQRRIAGLHQNTSIGSTDITDMWEPLEEGLLPYDLYSSIVLLANALCFHGYWMIVWFSVLLQPRNYSPCFNDHNHFVKEGSRYIINGVMKVAFGIQSGYDLLFLKTRDTKDPKNRCLVGLSPERGFSNIILKQPEFGNKATKVLFRFQWELILKLKNKTVAVLYYTKHVFWC